MSNFLKDSKRQSLLNASYDLFLEKGPLSTTISDIVKRANVAKGTFYLYFKDKEDVFRSLVDRVSDRILDEAYLHLQKNRKGDFAEDVVVFTDFIVEYFKRSPLVLKLLDRKFSWDLLEKELRQQKQPVVKALLRDVFETPQMRGREPEEVYRTIFVLMEMVGGACYSSIIEGQPADIDTLKPVLYGVIRKSLR